MVVCRCFSFSKGIFFRFLVNFQGCITPKHYFFGSHRNFYLLTFRSPSPRQQLVFPLPPAQRVQLQTAPGLVGLQGWCKVGLYYDRCKFGVITLSPSIVMALLYINGFHWGDIFHTHTPLSWSLLGILLLTTWFLGTPTLWFGLMTYESFMMAEVKN